MTATDKFKAYAAQYKKYAISIPQAVDTSTPSTAVILWGSMPLQNDDDNNEYDDHIWRNINLQMVFQGVARSLVHIESFNCELNDKRPIECIVEQNHAIVKHHNGGKNKKSLKTKITRWLPAAPGPLPPCHSKVFTGMNFKLNFHFSID